MTQIESHLGLNPISSPNDSDPDLMQDEAPVSHVVLNIQSSTKSLPVKHVLTQPRQPSVITTSSSLPNTSILSPSAPSFNDLKNSQVIIESKLDTLTGHIK